MLLANDWIILADLSELIPKACSYKMPHDIIMPVLQPQRRTNGLRKQDSNIKENKDGSDFDEELDNDTTLPKHVLSVPGTPVDTSPSGNPKLRLHFSFTFLSLFFPGGGGRRRHFCTEFSSRFQ